MEKLTITVKEMAEQLNISFPTAYKITKTEGFTVVEIGRRKVIPVDGLKNWLTQNAHKEEQHD